MRITGQRAVRVDVALVERNLCPSRQKAQAAVLAGQVLINRLRARKPSDRVRPTDELRLTAPEQYVSRGGQKLEAALQKFRLHANGWTAVDLGASTGGFTDCLLQHGAARIYAVDVGYGQLAWKLRRDPRVVVMERVNARTLSPAAFPAPFAGADAVVIDCSFISLRQLLPSAIALLRSPGRIVALIKPQFEAGKAEADLGAGVIRDPMIHQRVLAEMESFVRRQSDVRWVAVMESPLVGPAGNKEFLVLIEKA